MRLQICQIKFAGFTGNKGGKGLDGSSEHVVHVSTVFSATILYKYHGQGISVKKPVFSIYIGEKKMQAINHK